MQFYKTFDNNGFIRIENDGGSSLTVLKRGGSAFVLSLVVPEEDRGKGIGEALVEAVSRILIKRGVESLEAAYPDRFEEYGKFLSDVGFSEMGSVPVVSVALKTILSDPVIKLAILSKVDGAHFVSLADHRPDLLEELFVYTRNHLLIDERDIDRFFSEASGIVYDDRGNMKAFILCTLDEEGTSVHVDYIAGLEKGKPQYILSAVRGMLTGILEAGGERAFKTITMVAANPDVNDLIQRNFKDKEITSPIGKAVFAVKKLEVTDEGDNVEDIPDEDMENEWRREVWRDRLLANITLKMLWLRHINEKPSAKEEKSEKKDSVTETHSDERDQAKEPVLQKNEDETGGLEYFDTVRITADNLDRFKDYLDVLSVSDISRYYYRGLVALDDDNPSAIMVYELKNLDSDDDTEGRITYFSIKEEGAGRRLLSEYRCEAEKSSVKRTYFEFQELSDLEKEVLTSFGFSIQEREGQNLVFTLKELSAIPILTKKSKDYVKSIKDVSKKELKNGINSFLSRNIKGSLEDLGILPFDWFEQDISSCVVSDGGVTGFFLTHVRGDNNLSIDFLRVAETGDKLDILLMLRSGLAAALEKYPVETKVFVRRHNKEIWALLEKLLPDKSGKMVFAGEMTHL